MMTQVTPREGEKVLFVIRKSFLKLSGKAIKFLIFFMIGVVAIFLSQNEILTIAASVILLFSLTYAFYYFLIWFYDIYIITNQRVICVEQRSLFSRDFAEIELHNIKEITYSIHGVFATIFHFGLVKIKGVDQDIELTHLPDPDDFQEMLRKLSAEAKKSSGTSEMTAKELIAFITKGQK